MITTAKHIIETQGWQQGQFVKTDLWLGVNNIRHITQVMLIKDSCIYLESDKVIYTSEKPETHNTNDRLSIDYSKESHIVLAYTEAEALADAKSMYLIDTENENKRINEMAESLRHEISQIEELLGDYPWSHRSSVKQLNNFKDYKAFRDMLHMADFYEPDTDLNEDNIYALKDIYHQRSFSFRDKDNGNISTFVNLAQAISVETSCMLKGKSCVAINMPGNKSFYIYKKEHNDLYIALSTLYG